MTKTEIPTNSSESLSEQITRRVLLLSLIGIVGLSSTIILSLVITLQQVQNYMNKVTVEAVRTFDLFFLDIQSDLLATSDSLAARDDVELALLQLRARNNSFLDVLLTDFDGTVLAQRSAVGRSRQTRIERRPWLVSPPPFGEVYIGPVSFEGQTLVVDMAVTATDDIGLSSGLLLVRVDLTELWNTTLDIKVGERGYAYIADGTGQLVAYRNRRLLETGSNLSNLVGRTPQAIAESRLSFYTGLSDQLVLASAQPLKVVPWFAIVEQPIGEALAPFMSPMIVLLIVLVIVGLLLYDIAKFARVRIVAPLLSLSDVVAQMTGGRLDQRVEFEYDDELGQLARSFNSMAVQLQQVFETLEDRVVERTRRLQEQEERYRSLFEESPISLWEEDFSALKAHLDHLRDTGVTDYGAYFETHPEQVVVCAGMVKVVNVNKATVNLYKARDKTDLFENLPQVFTDESYVAFKEELVALAEGKTVFETESFNQTLTGEKIYVSLRLSVIPQDGEPLTKVLVSVIDITERVQAEEALRKATDRAKRSAEAAEEARLAAETANRAKSVFLANMSHELRTPLNAILGFTQIMRRDPTFLPSQQDHLRVIHRSGEHLLELINDILELSRIEAGRATFTKTDFDLYHLLATLESMFGIRARNKGVQLTFERAPDVPQYIHTDERKLRQVLINLLGNAIKFTEEGRVTLRVGQVDKWTSGQVGSGELADLQTCKLAFEVEDTGAGVAPEEMDQLFEAFTQTTSGQELLEGTGLGLPLSQRFVQLLGGDITVRSKVGEGSLFQFDIQVALPTDVSEIEKHKTRIRERVVGLVPEQRPTDGDSYRILVVEDRDANRVLLVQLLTAVGFKVREAANGQEAVAMWEAWKPHLIWMDMRMPVMDGYEATKRIKSLAGAKAPPIIALTAHAFEEERAAILAAGCDDYVGKPFREAEVFDKMAQHLGVHYIYQDLSSAVPDSAIQAQADLTPDDLADLPPGWVSELRHAAARGRAKNITDLIEQIRPDHARVAEVLTTWVHEFRFDRIMALTEPLADQGE